MCDCDRHEMDQSLQPLIADTVLYSSQFTNWSVNIHLLLLAWIVRAGEHAPQPSTFVFPDELTQASSKKAEAIVAHLMAWTKLFYAASRHADKVQDNLLRKYALDRIRALNKLVANRGKGKRKDEVPATASKRSGKWQAPAGEAALLPPDVKKELDTAAQRFADWKVLVGQAPASMTSSCKIEYVSPNKDKLILSMIRSLRPSGAQQAPACAPLPILRDAACSPSRQSSGEPACKRPHMRVASQEQAPDVSVPRDGELYCYGGRCCQVLSVLTWVCRLSLL